MPSKNVSFSEVKTASHAYPYARTCLLEKGRPRLRIEYGDRPDRYYGRTKLILAHKMYGFPYLDEDGELGVSNRDNYVIFHDDHSALEKIRRFLSTNFSLFVYECTRYRMKYLEKYAFELLPDISKMPDFPGEITDEAVMDFFGLEQVEKEYIRAFFGKRKYDFDHLPY